MFSNNDKKILNSVSNPLYPLGGGDNDDVIPKDLKDEEPQDSNCKKLK